MSLELLPDHRDSIIVVGTSARRDLKVLVHYLNSLDNQELPSRTRLLPIFVDDFTPQQADAREYLANWVRFRSGHLIAGMPSQPGDFAEGPQFDSHQWTGSSMARVGYNKNQIIQAALQLKADYVFFADTDLILDRTTVASLLSTEKPVVSAVFWTKWSKRQTETQKIPAQPQTWLQHPYILEGRGLEAGEFRRKLVERQLTQVFGFGAATLISRKVFEAGVDFSYLPDVPTVGLMGGEDRHFSIKCERLHIPCYADSWPDIFHCYHDEDTRLLGEMAARLNVSHPVRPVLGDLLSLRLRALEPLPVAPGKYQQLGPQLVRGRLGQIALEPEIEEAILGMERGSKQVVRVHHAAHHPMPFLRNRIRLYEVTLIDAKENRPAPVLETELYVAKRSGRVLDASSLTPEQQESLTEVANAG